MIEIHVKVADEIQTLTQKFTQNEDGLYLSHDCVELKAMVDQTLSRFKGDPREVVVKIKYLW